MFPTPKLRELSHLYLFLSTSPQWAAMALKKSSMTVPITNIPVQILLWTLASAVLVVKTATAAVAVVVVVTVYPQQL